MGLRRPHLRTNGVCAMRPIALQSSNAAPENKSGVSLKISVRSWSGPGDLFALRLSPTTRIRKARNESGTSKHCRCTTGVVAGSGRREHMNSVHASGSTRVGATSFWASNANALLRRELPFAGSPPSISSAIRCCRRLRLLRNVRLTSLSSALTLSSGSGDLNRRFRSVTFLSSLRIHPGRYLAGLSFPSSRHGVTAAAFNLLELISSDATVLVFFRASMMGGRFCLYFSLNLSQQVLLLMSESGMVRCAVACADASWAVTGFWSQYAVRGVTWIDGGAECLWNTRSIRLVPRGFWSVVWGDTAFESCGVQPTFVVFWPHSCRCHHIGFV